MEQRRSRLLVALIGVGCLGSLCIGAFVIGGGALLLTSDAETAGEPPPSAQGLARVPTQSDAPADIPTTAPTVLPSTAPTVGPELTGGQRLDDHSFFDDFSSDSLGWPRVDDVSTILAYEDGAYLFQIAETDYWDWVYFPDYFYPVEVWFDVRGPEGGQNGTFGIFCNFQDVDNYYYVEFYLGDMRYHIAEYRQGERLVLSEPNIEDSLWTRTEAFVAHTSPNSIEIVCSLDRISLTINNEFVDQVQVQQPLDQKGGFAFFVYAHEDAGPEGYKIWFDNVAAWDYSQ